MAGTVNPAAELQRLAALRRYGILDTLPEAEFDDIVKIAAQICGVPVSLITLLDERRQWFKARVGTEIAETPRAIAFCDVTIRQPDILVVPDLREHPQFAVNPLVTDSPNVRFYAGMPLTTPDGYNLGTLCVLDFIPRDLTEAQQQALSALARQVMTHLELRLAMRGLVEARNAAEAANNAKSEFLASVSHEIRTPMNAVVGLAAILERSQPLSDRQKQYVATLRQSADSLLALVNDLLDIAKIEAGAITLENIPFRPVQVVEDVVAMMAERVREKNLTLRVEASDAASGAWRGDPARLRQMVTNLCSNAVKFTNQGQVVVRLSCVGAGHDDGGALLEIAVSDTGMGIAPDRLEMIFEKFAQADASISRIHGGTGLGLAITRKLAGAMGGRIDVTSEVGEGSTFTLRLPLAMATDSADAPARFAEA